MNALWRSSDCSHPIASRQVRNHRTALTFLIARFIARPNLFLCFWLAVLVYELVRMPIESIGFNEFYFSTVLLFMALGSAFGMPAEKRAQPAQRFAPRSTPASVSGSMGRWSNTQPRNL